MKINKEDIISGDIECPICFDDKLNLKITFLKCDHWACRDCIKKLSRLDIKYRLCPICREPFTCYPKYGEVRY